MHRCTFGTNHVYDYGDPLDRLMDSAIRRWDGNSNPRYHLSFDTPEETTAIWVRLEHLNHRNLAARSEVVATPTGPVRYPKGDIPRFRAVLRFPSTGAETVLERKQGLQQFKQGAVISGYLLPGSLENYSGGLLRIESTNDQEVVIFRIP